MRPVLLPCMPPPHLAPGGGGGGVRGCPPLARGRVGVSLVERPAVEAVPDVQPWDLVLACLSGAAQPVPHLDQKRPVKKAQATAIKKNGNGNGRKRKRRAAARRPVVRNRRCCCINGYWSSRGLAHRDFTIAPPEAGS